MGARVMAKKIEKNFKIRLVKCGEVEPINTEQVIEDFFYGLLKQTKKREAGFRRNFLRFIKTSMGRERKWQRKQRNKS